MTPRRRSRALPLLVPCLLLTAACGRPPDQACVWTDVERVVAIGDVHGDYHQLVRALRLGQVIDDHNRWIGGRTHLVQTGDVLDRGPDSRKAMDLLMELEGQAVHAGGRVHALIGNHEAMNLSGDFRYVHQGEIASHGGEAGFHRGMSPDGVYGRWICGHNAIVLINDVLFVHGGLPLDEAQAPLERINAAIRAELAGKARRVLSVDPQGVLWTRRLAQEDTEDLRRGLESALCHYGARTVVAGHTVSKDGIQVRCGGRVILIDVGMSRYYGGPAACLLIENGRFSARYPDSTQHLSIPPLDGVPREQEVGAAPLGRQGGSCSEPSHCGPPVEPSCISSCAVCSSCLGVSVTAIGGRARGCSFSRLDRGSSHRLLFTHATPWVTSFKGHAMHTAGSCRLDRRGPPRHRMVHAGPRLAIPRHALGLPGRWRPGTTQSSHRCL